MARRPEKTRVPDKEPRSEKPKDKAAPQKSAEDMAAQDVARQQSLEYLKRVEVGPLT
jgi:hypothetical protein